MSAGYVLDGDVAVITLDNPPVNALSLHERRRLFDALDAACQDPAVSAVVFNGAGRGFSAGGDLAEFDSEAATAEPTPPTLFHSIEHAPKPVVASLHGLAAGGGLELALACHGRVAQSDTEVGLPESTLGLLPGAGGTQRLPRLVGLETALDMILSGRTGRAASLADTGLFDIVSDASPLPAALDLARGLAAQGHWRRTGDGVVAHDHAEALLAFARRSLRGDPALRAAREACIDCLGHAVTLPVAEGLKREVEAFHRLRVSPGAMALRHAFAAERRAREVPGLDAAPRSIKRVVVVGGGTMGSGIAICLAQAGLSVMLIERSPEALARALAAVRGHFEAASAKGRITPEAMHASVARVGGATDFAPTRHADLAIEAVFEDLDAKRAVFEQLDEHAPAGALLATNTSMLDVNQIAAFTRRPEQVLGLHFFSPAPAMKLVEVVRGERTAPDALATALSLVRRLRKNAVVCGVCDGFIGNRMLQPYLTQAGFLLDEGALPEQVDRAMEAWGMAMGPFRMCDLAGNDLGAQIRARRLALDPAQVESGCWDAVVELGRLGQKCGRGWYDHVPGQRLPVPSNEVASMVAEQSARRGLVRRSISDGEIVERLWLALVNEGARILEEGIAARESDLDLVYLDGYGFPRWRGGPMFAARQRGWGDVHAALQRLAARGAAYQDPVRFWRPAARIERLAQEQTA
ncbi:MAG: FAD-dependent oxidoreductase [Sphaerotilus natans subsp. sulfidivorans]|uniref:FAD-dependent oxidoreductase n=1 Tax=Sphaerotilus sulfidivorans TaxID=639200 RepID=UPI002351FD99|nr:FAD-dependent oxidoreductase [Sphaerotilus sulfidivorans]MCK6401319.1 FAD-dependent oxidoreductase [Sphaerotilus sulfidivorans]